MESISFEQLMKETLTDEEKLAIVEAVLQVREQRRIDVRRDEIFEEFKNLCLELRALTNDWKEPRDQLEDILSWTYEEEDKEDTETWNSL